jgi:DUF4097 and DUF4098 domain-containing protein YvlB
MDTTTFATPGPLDLHVEIPAGAVVVRAVETDVTRLDISGERDPDDVRVTFNDVAGGGHRLEIVYQRRGKLRWFSGGGLRVDVQVPIGTRLSTSTASADVHATGELSSVTVKTASGDVKLGAVTGAVDIAAASGDLTVGDVGGSLTCNSASGDVEAGRVVGELVVRTASGDVDVRRAASDARCTTVSGDINIVALVEGLTSLKSVSGDIEVGVEAGTRVRLDLSSMSGGTDSELQVTDRPSSPPNGAVARELDLRATSVSGDIKVRRADGASAVA